MPVFSFCISSHSLNSRSNAGEWTFSLGFQLHDLSLQVAFLLPALGEVRLTTYIVSIGRKQEMGVTGCSTEFSYTAEKAIVLQLTRYHWPWKTWPQLLKSEKKIVQCGWVLTSQRKYNNSTKIQRHWCWPSPPKQGLWERLSGLYKEFRRTRHSLNPRIDTAPAISHRGVSLHVSYTTLFWSASWNLKQQSD